MKDTRKFVYAYWVYMKNLYRECQVLTQLTRISTTKCFIRKVVIGKVNTQGIANRGYREKERLKFLDAHIFYKNIL